MKEIYLSEDGIKEIVNMASDANLFEPITRQEDIIVHNYLIMKLNKLGFNNSNLRAIVDYVMSLPEKKDESERDKVAKAYFGDTPYSDLD